MEYITPSWRPNIGTKDNAQDKAAQKEGQEDCHAYCI